MSDYPIVDWPIPEAIYTLAYAVTAFGTSQDEQDKERCGPLCELKEGADLMVCGVGFSERTVKVRYSDCEYYVFWQDLASAAYREDTTISDGQIGLLRLGQMLKKHA
jgi:hypothetical protein